jgi:hypothetical protein
MPAAAVRGCATCRKSASLIPRAALAAGYGQQALKMNNFLQL